MGFPLSDLSSVSGMSKEGELSPASSVDAGISDGPRLSVHSLGAESAQQH